MYTTKYKVLFGIYCFLILIQPNYDSYFAAILFTIGIILNSACLFAIFNYYHYLPQSKKNILIFLTRCLIIALVLMSISDYVISMIMFIWRDLAVQIVEQYFSQVCMILECTMINIGYIIFMIEIICFKWILVMFPTHFLGMNTVNIQTACFVPIILQYSYLIYRFVKIPVCLEFSIYEMHSRYNLASVETVMEQHVEESKVTFVKLPGLFLGFIITLDLIIKIIQYIRNRYRYYRSLM